MQMIIDEIAKIEAEAKRMDIPFVSICKKAKINNSTTQRWRSGENSPSLSKWHQFVQAFEALKKEHRGKHA